MSISMIESRMRDGPGTCLLAVYRKVFTWGIAWLLPQVVLQLVYLRDKQNWPYFRFMFKCLNCCISEDIVANRIM